MAWEDPGTTALVVPVPEAEPLIGAFRRAHTPSGRAGMPAHVTVIAPFIEGPTLTEDDVTHVQEVVRRIPRFPFTLSRMGRFEAPPTLYLAPEPTAPFVGLVTALSEEFPEHRPEFDSFVPHVTVAGRVDVPVLDEISEAVEPGLPLHAVARRVLLFERAASGAWRTRHSCELGDPKGIEIESASSEDTERVAGALARELHRGDVVTVSGELGSGKTTFVRGACVALGVGARVTSPTFTVGHRYEGDVAVSHLDLYRFRGVSAAEWGDLEPYFDGAIVFVEWPEAGAGALPAARFEVRLQHVDPTHRLIEIDSEEKSLLNRVFEGAHPRI